MYNWIYPNPVQLKNSIDLIGKSIESERKDSQFYQWLIDNIPIEDLSSRQSNKIKKTIESIRDDELRHNKMYKEMYYQITGKEMKIEEEEFIAPVNFRIGIEDAMMGELEAVKKYREIMNGLPSLYYRDKVFNILSDELRHANLYNYIYTNIITGKEK
ncbi:ferritin-like domain-containing protein [Romboutsia maritimum]|uniref:Ferritin-like domain-containing protein n=1 Tax=Romboutsia maritimum TaxID=2020948 RepID=A0A371IV21_9FIRM|nr:ferritin-like domain-containing protein [Romboutsia maritimum]RDY24309.1 ferritin-like domain-containing protein [Romboutsia maritimum]